MSTPRDADSHDPVLDEPEDGSTTPLDADNVPEDGNAAQEPPPVIVAGPGRWYRNARYLMIVGCLVMAAWFGHDGFVNWPAENETARARGYEKLPHTDFDILLQRLLAAGLPFAAGGILARLLYHSRGQYRLEDDVLSIPGHPPIPLASIRSLDKARWEKKGILYFEYDAPDSPGTKRAKLDAFVYDQKPTDAIVERIDAVFGPDEDAENDEDAAAAAKAVESEREEGL